MISPAHLTSFEDIHPCELDHWDTRCSIETLKETEASTFTIFLCVDEEGQSCKLHANLKNLEKVTDVVVLCLVDVDQQ